MAQAENEDSETRFLFGFLLRGQKSDRFTLQYRSSRRLILC